MDILKYKTLPQALTAHDLLKALAVVLMVIDHIGLFFFPDETWFRAIGRFSAPVWLFLIGYARTRQVPKSFWIGGALVWSSALVAGEYLFPVNMIATLILARLLIDGIMVRALQSRQALAGMFLVLVFMGLPTIIFFEYGTPAFLFAMAGYMAAHRERLNIPLSVLMTFTVASALAHALIQSALMPSLDTAQFLVMSGGLVAVCLLLLAFRPAVFSWPASAALRWPLQLMGRRTLEIYVMHLIFFRALGMIFMPERFGFMDFDFFAFGHLLRMFL